ncbi:hypothetical protein MUY27_00860 [Mucilaginibacter sp. RS28]|uniref:Uncharacterized protein n=1 Tax=Mucilaginibacter straminoryzae TaxID=2932774 RepID=A0A9X1X086_9SPHI|nr:hypothetical protein [Mucilaginibacter straminoryzae]MCJ8208236.1 hypothetical protein [Mucilaginibacter straminoryzae]
MNARKYFCLLLAFSIYIPVAMAQQEDKPQYVDGVKIDRFGSNINSSEIAYVENKPNGIFIHTRLGVRRQYWGYLRKKSDAYRKIAPNVLDDSNIQYIVNNVPLNSGYERILAGITNRNFIGLQVIDERMLNRAFNIYGKQYGVLIRTKR